MSTYYEEHRNDPKLWMLWDFSLLSQVELKQLFMGKIPSPGHRRLLGIRKIKKAK